jgi:Flp pilus assembly protein TadB
MTSDLPALPPQRPTAQSEWTVARMLAIGGLAAAGFVLVAAFAVAAAVAAVIIGVVFVIVAVARAHRGRNEHAETADRTLEARQTPEGWVAEVNGR